MMVVERTKCKINTVVRNYCLSDCILYSALYLFVHSTVLYCTCEASRSRLGVLIFSFPAYMGMRSCTNRRQSYRSWSLTMKRRLGRPSSTSGTVEVVPFPRLSGWTILTAFTLSRSSHEVRRGRPSPNQTGACNRTRISRSSSSRKILSGTFRSKKPVGLSSTSELSCCCCCCRCCCLSSLVITDAVVVMVAVVIVATAFFPSPHAKLQSSRTLNTLAALRSSCLFNNLKLSLTVSSLGQSHTRPDQKRR